MKNNRNFNRNVNNHSLNIKKEPNDNQMSINEENKIWNEQPRKNNYQRNYKNNNQDNYQKFNKNRFLGIKRESRNDGNNHYSPPNGPKIKPDNYNNSNNSNDQYNNHNNNYNSNINIKKENEDNYFGNPDENRNDDYNQDNQDNNNNFNNYSNNYNNNGFNNNSNNYNNNGFNNNSNNYNNNGFNNNSNNYNNNCFNNNYNNKGFNNNYNNNKYQNNQNNQNNNRLKFNPIQKNELPIYSVKDDILRTITQNRVTIISGNTGCGKSTQVPQYIYGYNCNNLILMTQPRRIAAVSIAKRLADEMHERLGGKIGYHVSMNPNFGVDTKIFVKTTGIFMEELIHKNLDYTHIIIDEVHERDIYVDLVLALIKWYFDHNPDSKIKLILMSATIAEGSFAEYLKDINGKDVPVIKIHETLHTVYQYNLNDIFTNLKYDKCVTDELKKEIDNVATSCFSQIKNVPVFMDELFPVVAAIIEKIENENPHCNNGVLIFVPGLAEIQELQDYLSRYFLNKNKLEFLILHSQISDDEQDKVFKYGKDKRKIILATNIAESSITISNIDFVIDFCLVKQTRFDEYQNTSVLELKWCSKASCQQRKGRTGRVNKGYYFQLITEKLYRKLEDHPRPEILRSPLETPILKLKIYEPEKEPQDILLKTISPPSEETIINTLFRLEKMGALIQGRYVNDLEDNEELKIKKNKSGVIFKKKVGKKNYYKSGIITKVGRIFAELPIDIKYSRLIMIAYALGEIDLGITLAAIISQDKSMFLSSDKCNRFNLYKSKNYYCFEKECDFIACYTAYKKWLYSYGKSFIKPNVRFDTQLTSVDRKMYKIIQKNTLEQALDLRVLKEIIKVENDLKKRLTKFNLYSMHLASFKDPTKTINFKQNEDAFLLKVILAGTFYNQIFAPEYDDTRNIEDEILARGEAPDQEKQSELRTIRIMDISEENAKKLINIIDAIVQPDTIIEECYDNNSEIYKIEFDKIEAVKKILFVTSAAIRRNKEIPVFQYIKNSNISTNKANSLGAENDNCVIIKLLKEPEYYYRVHYYDEYMKENVYPDKDSINLIQVLPNLEQLKLCKLVTDSYNNKSGSTFKKFARYTSVLPPNENFDKLMMLIFAPQYKMVGYKNKKTGKYLKYIGFQSYELTGLKGFSGVDFNNQDFSYERALFIKLDYVITNYHLSIIDEIRVMLNEMMKFKFLSKNKAENYINYNMINPNANKNKGINNNKNNKNNKNDKNDKNNNNNKKNKNDEIEDDLSKEEFDEIYREYKTKAKKIVETIHRIVEERKIRNISDEKYQELFDYINETKSKNPKFYQIQRENRKRELQKLKNLPDDFDFNDSDDESDNENNNENVPEEIPQEFNGYINQINELKKKVQDDDFLQLHEPLPIAGEYIYTNSRVQKELFTREKKIKNLYNEVVLDLRRMESLAFSTEPWLVCTNCCQEISSIKTGNPLMTNSEIGEHKIIGPWINENLKLVFKKYKNKEKKKAPLYDEEEKNKFIENLKNLNISFDNLFTCPSGKHIIGYTRNGERYIYYGSDLTVKYPDLTYDKISDKNVYINNFENIHERVTKIMEEKNTDDFKKKIFCKLCHFNVKNNLREFKDHLRDKIHEERLKELRKEFI